MEGAKVEIYLHTPLLKFKYRVGSVEKELLDGVVRLSATVLKESVGGLMVAVEEVSNLRSVERDLPFSTLFIPMGKIDFVVVRSR